MTLAALHTASTVSETGGAGISRCTLNSEFRNSYAVYSVSSLYSLISFNKRRKMYLVIIISISSVSTDK